MRLAVATCIVGLATVVGALAFDTDPFDVIVAASFASKIHQSRLHQTMARGMSETHKQVK